MIHAQEHDAARVLRLLGWTQRGTIWFDTDGIDQGWDTLKALEQAIRIEAANDRAREARGLQSFGDAVSLNHIHY